MKTTNFFWWHLQKALSEALIDGTDIDILIINPKLIKGFKKAYTSLPKTDTIDAWVIAEHLRFVLPPFAQSHPDICSTSPVNQAALHDEKEHPKR